MIASIDFLVERYTYITVWSEEDRVYLAWPLEISGARVDAKSHSEAIEEAKLATASVLETLLEIGRALPEPLGFQG